MATTPEEEEIIKKRFLTQTTVTRGEPPLKRLAQRCRSCSAALSRWSGLTSLQRPHIADSDLPSQPVLCHLQWALHRPAVQQGDMPGAVTTGGRGLPGGSDH